MANVNGLFPTTWSCAFCGWYPVPLARRISNVSRAQPVPEDLHTIEALLKERMPERHLLDILKDVQH